MLYRDVMGHIQEPPMPKLTAKLSPYHLMPLYCHAQANSTCEPLVNLKALQIDTSTYIDFISLESTRLLN